MRKILASALMGAAVLTIAAPAAAQPSERACNQGTARAHATVPHTAHQAHANIPSCH